MKKLIILSILIGVLLLSGCIKKGPIERINPDIPSDFLYQSRSDEIPDEYQLFPHLLENGTREFILINTERAYQKDMGGDIFCKPSGKEAEKIEYFYSSSGKIGGWHYRHAYVCENNYWILDNVDGKGMRIYGPFSTTS